MGNGNIQNVLGGELGGRNCTQKGFVKGIGAWHLKEKEKLHRNEA